MDQEVVVTSAGLKALENELEELKTVKRKDVAEKIKVARGYGDLSENSEYDEAKNEQGILEGRIAELEKMLKYVRVVDGDDVQDGIAGIGSKVTISDEDGDEDVYVIVGSTESNPAEGKISDKSPVGTALLGKKVGDAAVVTLPNGGTATYTVKKVERADI